MCFTPFEIAEIYTYTSFIQKRFVLLKDHFNSVKPEGGRSYFP